MASVNQQIYGLRCEINTHTNSLNEAKIAVRNIDEKIERLKIAKKSVSKIQQEVSTIKFRISHKIEQYDYQGYGAYGCGHRSMRRDWVGEQKNKFNKKSSEFMEDYISFQNQLNDYYDNICDEITRLENQRCEKEGIIGWCVNRINNLGNSIHKLIHTKEG